MIHGLSGGAGDLHDEREDRSKGGGSDATPLGSSSSQPAVVPLFPWQRRRGAAVLRSEVVIYTRWGEGLRRRSRWRVGREEGYCRKKRMSGKKKKRGEGGGGGNAAAVDEAAGTRGGQMYTSVSFVSRSFS